MKQQAKWENQIKRPTRTPCIDNILQGIECLNNLLQFPNEWMNECMNARKDLGHMNIPTQDS